MDYRYQKDFPNGLKDVLLSREDYHPLPRYEDEAIWQAVPADMRAYVLENAEKFLAAPMPQVTATIYMHYYRTGERTYDRNIDNHRRHAIFWLTAAECLERNGRYMDKLIDYIWALCETTSWVLPAHNWQGLEGGWNNDSTRPLPDIQDSQIDLFAGATGEYLAYILYIMRNKFDEISFLISERIEYELNKRIIEPFCNRRDAWWVSETTHNWHMWITSNCLAVILLAETNPAKRAKAAELALRYTEEFYRDNLADGSTIEAADYWCVSTGALNYALQQFKLASNGVIDHFDEPMVHNLASYLYKTHITGEEFYNYSYCSRFSRGYHGLELYQFGQALNDRAMMELGANIYHVKDTKFAMCNHIFPMFQQVLFGHTMKEIAPNAPYIGYYYSKLQQLMIARTQPGCKEGLLLGAKGYNGFSDSHQDGGSFILYNDSQPVYIELGNVIYSAAVIDERYRHYHFITLTENHSAITVNGYGHSFGYPYAASNKNIFSDEILAVSARTTSEDRGSTAVLSTTLGSIYPKESGVLVCDRTFTLDRDAGTVTVHQKVECDRDSDICLHFITCEIPVLEDGIHIGGTKLCYDQTLFTARTEEIDTGHDSLIESNWGKHVYRTTLTARAKLLDTSFTISKE